MTPTLIDSNSALHWLPAIVASGLPVPRTEIVPYRPAWLWPMLDGDSISEDFPLDKLMAACERIGYPVFLRTDLSSAKHEGPKAYKVTSRADLLRCIYLTFEDNALNWIADSTRGFLVREFLDIPSTFEAFGGLPIGREWRFFSDQEKVLCWHFYWPEEAFERFPYVPENWKGLLQEIRKRTEGMEDLLAMALRAVHRSAKAPGRSTSLRMLRGNGGYRLRLMASRAP